MPPDRSPSILNGKTVLRNIYAPSAIYVDTVDTASGVGRMLITPDRANRQRQLDLDRRFLVNGTTAEVGITILPEHSENHFPPESELPLILQGHKAMRLAGAALHEIAAQTTPNQDFYSRITGFDHATFRRPIRVGDEVVIKADLTEEPQGNEQGLSVLFKGKVSLYVGEELKSRFRGLTIEKRDEPKTEPFLEDQILEFVAQSYAVALLANRHGDVPVLASVGRTRFTSSDVVPDNTLIATAQNMRQVGQRFFVSSAVTDEAGNRIAEIEDIEAVVRSTAFIKLAFRLRS